MSLPKLFIDEINSYGADCLSGLAETLVSTDPEVSVRVNRSKSAVAAPGLDPVSWCETGFYLAGRPRFTFDPAMHQGLYYVQDASSMAITASIGRIAELESGRALKYLDACAAPGGKTTAAIASLPPGSTVVANEYDYRRAAILAENVAKWGAPAVMVTRGDTARFSMLRDCFDVIAADVPCSGEGMMRKDGEAVDQWSPSLVAECVMRQREIVDNLWPALRPGGYLIYSTCTFNRRENEEMVDYICRELGGETIDTGLCEFDGVSSAIGSEHHCCRFIPGRVRGEGLFLSVIRKDGDKMTAGPKSAKKPVTTFSRPPREADKAASWLDGDFELVMHGDRISALPSDMAKWMQTVGSWLDVITVGVPVATLKGRDLIPSQELALSAALRKDAFPMAEVDYAVALAYLRREAVSVEAPRGFVLLSWGGRPLGFVKNLGNRANNLYPAQWRILSSDVPDEIPVIVV